MTLTLTQARSVVASHLDDESNVRWSTAQLDTALGFALSQCLDEYLANGGDRFDTLLSTTSTTAGLITLTTQDPLIIKGVAIQWGNRYFPIKAGRPEERAIADNTARTVQVRYVPRMAIPSTTSHPLVGNGATAYNSWDAFDHWVCVQAAIFASVKDDELRNSLASLEASLRSSVLGHPRMPLARQFPTGAGWHSEHIKWIRDTWSSSTKQLALVLT